LTAIIFHARLVSVGSDNVNYGFSKIFGKTHENVRRKAIGPKSCGHGSQLHFSFEEANMPSVFNSALCLQESLVIIPHINLLM